MKRRECPRNGTIENLRAAKVPRYDLDEPVIIIHESAFSDLMQRKNIPYGIQFELARVLTSGDANLRQKYWQFVENLSSQPQTNDKLHAQLFENDTRRFLLSEREVASTSPWIELDKEDLAFSKDPRYAGIGNNDDFPGWWAGKVDFQAKLEDTGDRIVIEKATLGPSNKIKRRFGSSSLIRVKISTKRYYAKDSSLVQFFKRPFVLWNHVFRAFFAKDGTVFLFHTNETCSSNRVIVPHNAVGFGLLDLINWIIPLKENGDQKICKWASRMALGLSSSIPGPRLTEDDFDFIPDIVMDEDDPSSNMTDGCGISSLYLNKGIYETLGEKYLQSIPTAIQFRFAGAKGLIIVTDDEEKTFAQIRLRKSQIKIDYPEETLDPSHLTLDILRFSRTKTPARLSEETIKNLHHNGVPKSVFIDLLRTRLTELVDGLTAWDGPDAMHPIRPLWKAVEAAGSVISSRKARESITDSRSKGFGDREEDEEDEDGIDFDTSSKAWWRDPISGCPSSIAETILELLDSGFTPLNSPYLRDKLKNLIKSKINTETSKLNYVVPQSASAFVVPDPYNVLEPDQIQFKSSRREFATEDGTKSEIILGEVLMMRNPCKVPTDVRKVLAVQHPALRNMVDVIVCSVQGYRRLLDFLAGGDYDGDRAIVIWDKLFVDPFTSPPEKFSKTPAGLDCCFSMDEQTVAEAMSSMGVPLHSILQDYLLGSLLNPSYVGEYSRLHENAIYKYGYDHWRTIKLAYKFCIILDSAKTGHLLRPSTYQADRSSYSHRIGPSYKNRKSTVTSNDFPLERGEGLPEFIIDILYSAADKLRDYWLEETEKRFKDKPLETRPDPDLISPWTNYETEAGSRREYVDIRSDLKIIADHVEKMYERRNEAYGNASSFTAQNIVRRQNMIRDLSMRFASFPEAKDLKTFMDPTMIARLRASYAYLYATRGARTSAAQFPFDRAFRELCAIKAQAGGAGLYKVCSLPMYELKKL